MTMPSSFNVSGLLGGTAGQIDTTTLISELMQAAAVPQTQLQNQLTTLQSHQAAYQQINTDVTALQTAAQALTDPSGWSATTATSTSSSVAASTTASAQPGSTTFSVTKLAQAQTSTVATDSNGNVVSDPTAGITITVGNVSTNVALTSGSATDVASAINAAGLGVRASVVSTDTGNVLQLTSSQTGTASAFSVSGLESPEQDLVAAQNAQITVGDPSAGGYSVSSPSNTFSSFIPGVVFSVAALASNVTVTVASDEGSASNKVQALVDAANTVMSDISQTTGQGDMLEGDVNLQGLASSILSSISDGAAGGTSLNSYGLSIDSKGNLSFDAAAFATAYSADPAGTQTAVSGSFATALSTASSNAVAPVSGSLTQVIASETTEEAGLTTDIGNWTTRLSQIQTSLQAKYTAMETALGQLQSTQTYLTSMFNSISGNSSSSSSSSS
jgi:flagellar hook-associated protein 2